MNRRRFLTSGALAGAITASHPPALPAATPKRALMKAGATVGGEGGGRGAGRGEDGTPAPEAPARGGRRGGGEPRDPEQGFRSLGRWGIKNVVATARIADGRIYATPEELKRMTDIADK